MIHTMLQSKPNSQRKKWSYSQSGLVDRFLQLHRPRATATEREGMRPCYCGWVCTWMSCALQCNREVWSLRAELARAPNRVDPLFGMEIVGKIRNAMDQNERTRAV